MTHMTGIYSVRTFCPCIYSVNDSLVRWILYTRPTIKGEHRVGTDNFNFCKVVEGFMWWGLYVQSLFMCRYITSYDLAVKIYNRPPPPPPPTTLCPLVQPVDKCILCTGSTGQVNILNISLWTCIYSVNNPLDMYLLCIYLEHDHLNRYILCSLYRIIWSGIYYLQDPLI